MYGSFYDLLCYIIMIDWNSFNVLINYLNIFSHVETHL